MAHVMVDERVFTGSIEGSLIIITQGHLTAQICPSLNAYILKSLESDSSIKSLRFDLSKCDYMDSTFLGLIVSCVKVTKAKGILPPIIHEAQDQCMSLLRTMGMIKMLSFSSDPCPHPAKLECLSVSDSLTAKYILQAHRDLGGLSKENFERFESLIQTLDTKINAPNREPG